MPFFKCPQCSREGIVPLAFCEEVLSEIPYDFDGKRYLLPCIDCQAGLPPQSGTVKWEPPNLRLPEK